MDQNQSESIVDQPSIDYTQLNREIRVFLSSTFKDMQTERDYLLKHVFPEIRALCAERDVGFTEVDLRWGVTEEESKHGKTVELCLTNIDRCRDFPPFFIGFMGERYGWIPEDHHLTEYWKDQPKDEQGNFLSPYAQKIKSALAKGISVTELEMQFGVFEQPAEVQANALFYLRDVNYTKSLYEQAKLNDAYLVESAFYSDTRPKDDALLAQLKAKIRASGHLIIDNYTSVEFFGKNIKEKLLAELDHRFPAEELPTYEERVLREHARYAQSRRQAYIALPGMRDSVNSFLQQQAVGSIYSKPILITGVSGLGKSAFVADLQNELATDSTNLVLLSYFTGADGFSSLGIWRDMVFYQLRKQRGDSLTQTEDNPFATADRPKQDDDAKWQRLSNELSDLAHSTQKTVVLLLDAINQMSQAEEAILTVQSKLALPANCRLLVTTTPELLAYINTNRWQVVEMIKPDDAQAKEIIKAYTEQFYKKLNEVQIAEILSYSTAYIPLYLKVVLEELRLRSKHEGLTHDINKLMDHSNVQELFKAILPDWDSDFEQYTKHKNLFSRALSMIASSREGLTERELSFLIADKQADIDPETNLPKMSTVTVTNLLAVLSPYMVRRNDSIYIMHKSLELTALSLFEHHIARYTIVDVFSTLYKCAKDNYTKLLISTESLYQLTRLAETKNIDSEYVVIFFTSFYDIVKEGFEYARKVIHEQILHKEYINNFTILLKKSFVLLLYRNTGFNFSIFEFLNDAVNFFSYMKNYYAINEALLMNEAFITNENIKNNASSNVVDSCIYVDILKLIQSESKYIILLADQNEEHAYSLSKALLNSYRMDDDYDGKYLANADYQHLVFLLLKKITLTTGNIGILRADMLVESARIHNNSEREENFILEAEKIYKENININGVKEKLEQIKSGVYSADIDEIEMDEIEPNGQGMDESQLESLIAQYMEENDH